MIDCCIVQIAQHHFMEISHRRTRLVILNWLSQAENVHSCAHFFRRLIISHLSRRSHENLHPTTRTRHHVSAIVILYYLRPVKTLHRLCTYCWSRNTHLEVALYTNPKIQAQVPILVRCPWLCYIGYMACKVSNWAYQGSKHWLYTSLRVYQELSLGQVYWYDLTQKWE